MHALVEFFEGYKLAVVVSDAGYTLAVVVSYAGYKLAMVFYQLFN